MVRKSGVATLLKPKPQRSYSCEPLDLNIQILKFVSLDETVKKRLISKSTHYKYVCKSNISLYVRCDTLATLGFKNLTLYNYKAEEL